MLVNSETVLLNKSLSLTSWEEAVYVLGGLGLNGPGLFLPEDGSETDGCLAQQKPPCSLLPPDVTSFLYL